MRGHGGEEVKCVLMDGGRENRGGEGEGEGGGTSCILKVTGLNPCSSIHK